MPIKPKVRKVYYQRLANRQAADRLRRVYLKLYEQGQAKQGQTGAKPINPLPIQEKQP